MELSSCCKAELKPGYFIEYFHGCDDDYELKIPCQVCSKCGNKILPSFAPVDRKTEQSGNSSYQNVANF